MILIYAFAIAYVAYIYGYEKASNSVFVEMNERHRDYYNAGYDDGYEVARKEFEVNVK